MKWEDPDLRDGWEIPVIGEVRGAVCGEGSCKLQRIRCLEPDAGPQLRGGPEQWAVQIHQANPAAPAEERLVALCQGPIASAVGRHQRFKQCEAGRDAFEGTSIDSDENRFDQGQVGRVLFDEVKAGRGRCGIGVTRS